MHHQCKRKIDGKQAKMNIKPTRSELIKLKKLISLAIKGHKMLKKKRDGLVMEMFEILKRSKLVRAQMTDQYIKAVEMMNIARAVETDTSLKSLAFAIKDSPKIEMSIKNIMGVRVPNIKVSAVQKPLAERGYGYLTTPAVVNEAISSYEELLETIIIAAEVEISMKKLLIEIEKTRRRVNALEFEVIPKLERMKNFIALRLEEIERENIFRTKMLKRAR